MSQFPYAWTDSLNAMYPVFDVFGTETRGADEQRVGNPTHRQNQASFQPFTKPENVSAAAFAHHHAVDHMARQRQQPPPGPSSAVAARVQGPVGTMAGPDHGACFLSAPCEKTDCDEASICYDYAFAHHDDVHCPQDAFNCPDAFDCADDNCNVDWLCTDLTCHEPNCDQDHSQDCTHACAAVSCSDPACNEDHLYCCLSDICPHPHRSHTDCSHPPCQDACTHPSAPLSHHITPHHSKAPSTIAASQDAMSTSTISTPTTDSIPTPDNLQSLIEAASILPPIGFGFQPSLQPPRKRMRLDESASSFHDFSVPFYAPHEYWPMDLSHSFSSAHMPVTSQPSNTSASPAVKTKVRQDKTSRDIDEIPVCRWHDEVSGPCNRVCATIEDLHNHVKEHTGSLIPSKMPNRTFVCRWEGCEKDAPFGTKNHLDRHMQNHTRFKPFACSICGHRCVTQQQLNNHLTTHSREKKFKCDFPGCGKVFGVKTALSTHKRTHTNEKPFSCRWCGDSYSDSSNLSKHRKTVHEDDKTAIPCPHEGCEYRDSRAQRLERHCRDSGHGLTLLNDAHKWSEYTRKKQVRSRTASVAPSLA